MPSYMDGAGKGHVRKGCHAADPPASGTRTPSCLRRSFSCCQLCPPAFCLLADICAVCIHAAWPWEALVQARLQSCAGVPALRSGLPPSVQCSCHPSPAPWPAQTRTADDSQCQSGGEKGQTRPGLAPRTAGRCPMRSRVCTRISSLTAARQTPFPKSTEDAEEAGRTQGNYTKNVLPCL